jgi:transposase
VKKTLCNGLDTIVSQALKEMEEECGHDLKPNEINLAELERRTHIFRSRLRTWKKKGFLFSNEKKGYVPKNPVLRGYTELLDELLRNGVCNSNVCLKRLQAHGYTGSVSTIKRYIHEHKELIPPKRRTVEPQGNRGRRYETAPGENFQMDWGFVNVKTNYGKKLKAACFAMICHHCGQRYVEFFPNAKQENLFIGMLHAFRYMGVPTYVLTDNMKSVVIRRDWSGEPV